MSEIHPSARQELEEATLYYAEISPELAERFLQDFEQTLSFIEAMPLAWAIYYLDLRSCFEFISKINYRLSTLKGFRTL